MKCLFHWVKKVGEILLGGILEGLIVAWILVQFGVDKICIEVFCIWGYWFYSWLYL